jgi:SAM-dependent methyltransferase
MDIVGEKTLEVMGNAVWYNKWILQMSRKYLGKNVLEVGAGIGNFTGLLSKDHKVTAVEINSDYLKYLNKNFKNVSSGFGDIEKGRLFFNKKQFDSIICFNVLEHIKDDLKALMNMYKLLVPGGHLIVIVPAHKLLFSDFDKNLGHFRRYNIAETQLKMKDAGFNIISIRYLNWVSAIGWFIFLKLTKNPVMPGREVKIFGLIGPFLLSIEKFITFPFGLSVYCVAQKQ